MEILEECNLQTWRHRERYWIAFLKGQGEPLVNIRAGGDTTSWQPEEERAWKRKKATGRRLSPESRRKISEHLKGHEVTTETRAKLRVANAEQFSDAKLREKHSAGLRRWQVSLAPEERRPVITNLQAGQSGHYADNTKMQEGRRRWLAEHPDKAAKLTENFGGKTQWTGTTAEERSERLRQRWANRTPEQREAFRVRMCQARAKYVQEHPEAMRESAARARAAKESKE